MDKLVNHIENLKSALLSLPPTGEQGFEGLVGTTLYEITGIPFRLAVGGLQFGVDGKPTHGQDNICFEAKLYKNYVPRDRVISKIAGLRDTDTDIWVLGATCKIGSQLADEARQLGNDRGIVVLILDWSKTGYDIPSLAIALSMGGNRVKEFFKCSILDDKTFQEALSALEAIKSTRDFALHAKQILAQCNEPTMGWVLAQRANTEWLKEGFSNKRQAIRKFYQPLSPGETGTTKVWQRKPLIDKLYPYFTSITDSTLVCILGGEGCGKSWLVAQCWLALDDKPLMVFLSPEDFNDPVRNNDIVDTLISSLIRQTGDRFNSIIQERWRRKLNKCQRYPVTDNPRLVVFIDGLNQRPEYDWARIIDGVVHELEQLGGCLIVTARTPYFQSRVKGRLYSRFTKIIVPEWTESERDERLIKQGINASFLHPTVAASLCNPRLLGIAFELLDKADITNLEELSVSRLLFEHMRMNERDSPMPQPADQFARQLQDRAQEILYRIKTKKDEDLTVFEGDIGAVADGRFYQSVNSDPTRYCLKDDGLTLALGFAIINRLLIAKRNARDLHAELATILEPIATLDNTADVIIAALTIAVLKDSYSQTIAASLVKGFSLLQNPDQSKYPVFISLAKSAPQGFLDAAHSLILAGGHQPNFDWIQGALIEASSNNCAWQIIADKVHLWLSVYSLSPERGTFKHHTHDLKIEVQEEHEKNQKKITKKLKSLSKSEQSILESLKNEDGDLSRLSRLAMFLLAGKPLVSFAKSFVNWSFSNALNSDHTAPYDDFNHLVSLNRVDWSRTREALLEASNALRDLDVSETGKWALVNILRATGNDDDDKEARALAEGLITDKPIHRSWRLIEDYCATDPCDPSSEEPENVLRTAEQYRVIDVNKLRQSIWLSSEDHFFNMARPGIARFRPGIAISKHRELATNVLERSGITLLAGLFELRKHNALFSIEEACQCIEKRHNAKGACTNLGLSEKDEWVAYQYLLLLAFPFLNAQEQANVLLSGEADEKVLLSLIKSAKQLGEKEFESLLEFACVEDKEHKQSLLLALAEATSVQLSAKSRTYVAKLFKSVSGRVRALALGVIAQSGSGKLLEQIVKSDWTAMDIETENGLEPWFGSAALLEAAARGLIAHNEVIDRISARLYGRAAALLDESAVRDIAGRINVSIEHAVALDDNIIAPDIELKVHPSAPYEPHRFKLSERTSKTYNIAETMQRLTESKEDFEKRQKRNYDTFLEFKATLTRAKASIILDYLSLEEFARLIQTTEELAEHWYNLFVSIAKTKLPAVHNFVVLLAHAIGAKSPGKAEKLFRRVENNKPLVRFNFGDTGVHLDMIAIWSGTRNAVLDNLRFERLDRACTDHDLSLEVLAALFSGQQELLTEYIGNKLHGEEPSEVSRGIMVAGFSDQSEFNDEILKKYEGAAGLIGSAQKAAKYAYERNVWAKHWFKQMCQTGEGPDFWRYGVLFSKIVDGRFGVWKTNYKQVGNSIKLFGLSTESNLKCRFSRWERHRNKKLFGLKAPASIYVIGKHI